MSESSPDTAHDDAAAVAASTVAPPDTAPPVTAQMLQADPRITHDVIERSNPDDPEHTFET